MGTKFATTIAKRKILLLCPLPRKLLWIFSLSLRGDFALKNGGDFWWIFSGLRFPRNEARKLLKKFRGEFGAKFGAKFGTKIRRIRGTFVLRLFWCKILRHSTFSTEGFFGFGRAAITVSTKKKPGALNIFRGKGLSPRAHWSKFHLEENPGTN